jgi:hypothetical protein
VNSNLGKARWHKTFAECLIVGCWFEEDVCSIRWNHHLRFDESHDESGVMAGIVVV